MAQQSPLFHHTNSANHVGLHEPIKIFGQLLRVSHLQTSRRATRTEPLVPDFDLRESAQAYYLEGEFPGLGAKDVIKLRWLDGRILVVEAEVVKTNLGAEWGEMDRFLERTENVSKKVYQKPLSGEGNKQGKPGKDANEGLNDANKVKHQTDTQPVPKQPALRNWLSERRCGNFHRYFTFPHPVDFESVKAKLSHGLLRVRVPKIDPTKLDHRDIHIEIMD
jgi:HSP20 family protein